MNAISAVQSALNMTDEDLAFLTGKSRLTVYEWTMGRSKPDKESMRIIHRALECRRWLIEDAAQSLDYLEMARAA